MKNDHHHRHLSKEQLNAAKAKESSSFEEYYLWIEKHMPPIFFEEIETNQLMLIAHHLMYFPLQDFSTRLYFKNSAIILCLDAPDVDINILKNFQQVCIKNYQTFISDVPAPFPDIKQKLRLAVLYFTSPLEEEHESIEKAIPKEQQLAIFEEMKQRNKELSFDEFDHVIHQMDQRFLRSLTKDRLILSLEMFQRAKTRDHCQYELRYNEDWATKGNEIPSLQIVLAWRNPPKHRFFYRLAKMIHRHHLNIKRVNAGYISLGDNDIVMMSLGLHGMNGKAAWEGCDMTDFLQELALLKYFDDQDSVETVFIQSKLIRGNLGHFIRCLISFIHQTLLHADVNLYSLGNIEEGICRHPELIVKLCNAFEHKFHPIHHELKQYEKEKKEFLELVQDLDTGQPTNDVRRKNILIQAMNFVEYTLKTNFYRNNKSALAFRLNPLYLDEVPFNRKEKFPEMPFAIFFIKGMSFIAFHIRFKDLARGGLRTVIPSKLEQMVVDRNNVFAECYNLAYTQQKKNKDIPEGGAKVVIFLNIFEQLEQDAKIYVHDLLLAHVDKQQIKTKLEEFKNKQRSIFLYQSQRAFVHSILTLVNCYENGELKAKDIISYYDKAEYLYLGPDENMHNVMIEWIASYSKHVGYKAGSAFISSKPTAGINHKEYGVTSLGVNVYMHEILKYLGINPEKDTFTVKITGGPDGDVAGNQMLNLYRYYPKTAKLLAVTDVSGTINDPQGLDLEEIAKLFHDAKPIRFYPAAKLSEGGFLLDMFTKKEESAYAQQTLCLRKVNGKVKEEWLSGNDMNHLFRHNVHQTKTDIFIPGGGRPRTLNGLNYKDFLDEEGKPTSRAIIEGANLYLTPEARYALEEKGVLIIKDSSANKGGVICSSCEVQIGLILSDEEFIENKPLLMKEVLHFIKEKAKEEALLMLKTYDKTDLSMIDISDLISERINTFTYQILDYLTPLPLSNDPNDPYIRCLLKYCLPMIRNKYQQRILNQIPDNHKKAMIACYIAGKIVYSKGLDPFPSIVDVLPLIVSTLSQ
ncbi:MAG: NAD-glutamate dehydrogenase [Chlamydiales bacterium]|nr:NAD-glutamate dehydrogenase [Chlamydiales bacterium]